MTNPSSPSGAERPGAKHPGAAQTDAGQAEPLRRPSAKRKGPRRATAPAGAPVTAEPAGAAVLLIGAKGELLPPATEQLKQSPPAAANPGQVPAAANPGQVPAAAKTPVGTVPETSAPAGPTPGAGHEVTTGGVPAAELRGDGANDTVQPASGGAVDSASKAFPKDSASAPSKAVDAGAPAKSSTAAATSDKTAPDPVQETGKGLAGNPGEPLAPLAPGVAAPGPAAPGVAQAAGVASAAQSTEQATVDSAHQSRRERRLAEQNPAADVDINTGASGAGNAKSAAASEPVTAALEETTAEARFQQSVPQDPGRRRSRLALFLRGALSLLLISIFVAALGTALVRQDNSAAGPADTEVNRQSAWERTTALSAAASLLSDGGGTPTLAKVLARTAENLEMQAAALDDGLPVTTDEATDSATTATATLTSLLTGLTGSGEKLMQDALTAERAMGRVFAAVGTSQLLEAQELGAAAGVTVPASAFLSAQHDFAMPQGPQCSSTLEPRSGVTVDSALRAAALGEQQAVYGYQVAASRLDEPQQAMAINFLARHQKKLDLLNAELTVRCLQAALPVAGFELDPSFTTTPLDALARLESELAAIHAGLVALSTPAAETGLPGSTHPTSDGPDSSAGVATDAAPSADVSSIQPANNGLLREMSVAWLLDSAIAQQYWGGTVGALAGMEP
ncbi:DUF4439 domain-containing protein [Specibacter sp. NPDC057265]|uniref:DUF4439 domain-containing protein n=1 Tax=Specibacter sp. NPDC057265 TaxID=3346075 RepID=UPI0036446527